MSDQTDEAPDEPLTTVATPASISAMHRRSIRNSQVEAPVFSGPEKGYIESERHVPRMADAVGTFRTDIEGAFLGDHTRVSPTHAVARQHALASAVAALDPDDPTPEDIVVLPNAGLSPDGAKRSLVAKAQAAGVDTFGHSIPLSTGDTLS